MNRSAPCRRRSDELAESDTDVTIYPATPDRWQDFERLMGPKGAVGGCWCMTWRYTAKQMKANKGETAKADIRTVFETGPPPGLIAYDGGEPVAWCSIAPRDVFIRLGGSKVLSPVDDAPVWSVSCFFIKKGYRGGGMAQRLLQAADDFVRSHGGRIIEGYPIDPVKKPYPAAYAWTGFAGSFRKAGFREVARRSESRPIMRRELD